MACYIYIKLKQTSEKRGHRFTVLLCLYMIYIACVHYFVTWHFIVLEKFEDTKGTKL